MVKYNEILANIANSGDYSRSNRFEVVLYPPTILSNRLNESQRNRLRLNAKSATIGGRSLEISETTYGGGLVSKKALGVNYADLEVSFFLSEDFLEKEVLDAWQSLIFDPLTLTSRYPDDYYGRIEVTKLALNDNKNLGIKYVYDDAFPNNVQDISQDYDSASTIDILPVTFSYQRWFKEI